MDNVNNTNNTADYGTVFDYRTGEAIRPATAEDLELSLDAARFDGGAGCIMVEDRVCYVGDYAACHEA